MVVMSQDSKAVLPLQCLAEELWGACGPRALEIVHNHYVCVGVDSVESMVQWRWCDPREKPWAPTVQALSGDAPILPTLKDTLGCRSLQLVCGFIRREIFRRWLVVVYGSGDLLGEILCKYSE